MPDVDLSPFLNLLADTLCREVADGGANQLVHVKTLDDGVEVGTLPLDQKHPSSVLIGTVAPADWVVLGVACRGRPFDLNGDRRRKLPASVTSVVLVQRDGAVIGRLDVGGVVTDSAPGYGLVVDCLQRAFGLPTAAPQVGTGARFTSFWLEKVLVAASILPPATLTWPVAAALHPAAHFLDDDEWADGADLVASASALERAYDWERLRWLVVEGGWQEPHITPVDAAWLDTGSFARLVMADAAPIPEALAQVRRTAGAHIARRCRTVVQRLGYRAGPAAA